MTANVSQRAWTMMRDSNYRALVVAGDRAGYRSLLSHCMRQAAAAVRKAAETLAAMVAAATAPASTAQGPAAEQTKPVEVRVRVEVDGASNYRRWSRPWIARVRKDMSMDWGNWYAGNGGKGTLEVMAIVGGVVAHGQKDGRRNGTWTRYNIVLADGSLGEELTREQAHLHLNP